MNGLSLFSGACDGLGIAYEAVGGTIVGQVEIDPWCRRVLAKHWPEVPRLADIRDVKGDEFGHIDVLFGGPPCQPASAAGQRKGAADDRWLWPEFLRLCGAVRPRWVVAENPRGLHSLAGGLAFRGILGAFTDLGYRVGWCCYGAGDVGAPHRRERIFIVAHTDRGRQLQPSWPVSDIGRRLGNSGQEPMADASSRWGPHDQLRPRRALAGSNGAPLADARRIAGAAGPDRAGRQARADAGGCSTGAGMAVATGHRWQQGGHDAALSRGPGSRVGHRADPHHPGCTQQWQRQPAGQEHAAAQCRSARPPCNGDCGRAGRAEADALASLGLSADGVARGLLRQPAAARGWPGWPARPGEAQKAYEPTRLIARHPDRARALTALGNSVIWLQAAPIFEAIMAADQEVR